MQDCWNDPPDEPETPEWYADAEMCKECIRDTEKALTDFLLRGHPSLNAVLDSLCATLNALCTTINGFANKLAELERRMNLGDPDMPLPDDMLAGEAGCCRNCGRDSQGCVYCQACADAMECPHGNKLGHCDHCDHLSDIAHDAARESR